MTNNPQLDAAVRAALAAPPGARHAVPVPQQVNFRRQATPFADGATQSLPVDDGITIFQYGGATRIENLAATLLLTGGDLSDMGEEDLDRAVMLACMLIQKSEEAAEAMVKGAQPDEPQD